MMKNIKLNLKGIKTLLPIFIVLFVSRLLFGLCAEFWFEDELQIYLIGLKFYTSGVWPYFGPDVVYTNSQIPGALQGLLTGLPFFVVNIPEAPVVFLNIFTFSALIFFGWYIVKRLPQLPKWFVFSLVLTLPWVMNFSTHVINPSYVLPFSILFFIGFFESVPNFSNRLIKLPLALFMMGFSAVSIMQLHLSWVLLIPYSLISLFFVLRNTKRVMWMSLFSFFTGLLLGAILIIPTFLNYGLYGTGGTESNLVFNPDNFKNILTVLMRFLSLATYEIPYLLGGNTKERLDVVGGFPWIAPSAILLMIAGWLQIAFFLAAFFLKKNKSSEWSIMKILMMFTFILVFVSFFFSVKGPSSHTFYIVLPIPLLYSFYCYAGFVVNFRYFKVTAATAIVLSIILYSGLALYNYNTKSLYKDREKVEAAIENKDYKILGLRRYDIKQ